MQVGVIRSICLLTFLLSEGKTEELNSLKESKDVDNLKDVAGLIQSGETPDDLKSGKDSNINIFMYVNQIIYLIGIHNPAHIKSHKRMVIISHIFRRGLIYSNI